METRKRRALEAEGWRFGDAADFLGLTDAEQKLVNLRIAVSRAVRKHRERKKMTQQELAKALKSSQSRVAKLEAGAPDVSLDLLFRSLFVVGGRLGDITGRS